MPKTVKLPAASAKKGDDVTIYTQSVATLALTILKQELRTAKKRAVLKKICLQFFRVIGAAYAGDPDFEA